jgi:MFS family permease
MEMIEERAAHSDTAIPRRRRRLILGICCMSILMVGLDNTIVNVALPSIGRQLHTAVSGLQWTVDAYTLVLASLLVLSGSMGDRLGRRRVFQTGLALFALASLLCSVAPSLEWLIAFRALQAIGGSMLKPGGAVDHPQRLHRCAGASAGDRCVGRDRRQA